MQWALHEKGVLMNRRTCWQTLALAMVLNSTPTLVGEAKAAAIGDTITLPTATLIDGTVLAPDHWRNKVLIIERFATWCPFCKVQNPKLDALLRANKCKGIEVLALSVEKTAAEVSKYMKARGYAFNAAMMTPEWRCALGGIKGLPVIWVIGRNGKLTQIEAGEVLDEDIAELARWL